MKIILLNFQGLIGIGDKTKNNGILFLISTGDRELRIEVGNGLEGTITDGKAGRILDDYVIPYLRNDDWNNGIQNGFNAILEEVCKEYQIEINGLISASPVSTSTELSKNESAAFDISFILLFASIIARRKLKSSKKKATFAFRSIAISTILQCIIAGGVSLFVFYLFINFLIVIFALLGNVTGGGGYYGGGHHGGGSFHSSSGSHGGGGHFSGGGASRRF